MSQDLTNLCLHLFNRTQVKSNHIIESWDVIFLLFQNFVRFIHFGEISWKHIFSTKTFRVNPLIFWLLMLMGRYVSLSLPITLFNVSSSITPLLIMVSNKPTISINLGLSFNGFSVLKWIFCPYSLYKFFIFRGTKHGHYGAKRNKTT